MGERREAKKLDTRQRISDEATALFFARGFEHVTVDDVAAAARVSRMTVFNYFPRKEDLMLDRQDDLKLAPLRAAIRDRPVGTSPVEALRTLVQDLRASGHPLTLVNHDTADWWRFIGTSPSLQARLRELFDQAADGLAVELGGATSDGSARLAAGVIVLTVRIAREDAVRAFESGASEEEATRAFLTVLDRGFDAVDQLLDQSRDGDV